MPPTKIFHVDSESITIDNASFQQTIRRAEDAERKLKTAMETIESLAGLLTKTEDELAKARTAFFDSQRVVSTQSGAIADLKGAKRELDEIWQYLVKFHAVAEDCDTPVSDITIALMEETKTTIATLESQLIGCNQERAEIQQELCRICMNVAAETLKI